MQQSIDEATKHNNHKCTFPWNPFSLGTPVNRIPIMAKQILDLYQLYRLVVQHGGLVQVSFCSSLFSVYAESLIMSSSGGPLLASCVTNWRAREASCHSSASLGMMALDDLNQPLTRTKMAPDISGKKMNQNKADLSKQKQSTNQVLSEWKSFGLGPE